MLLNSREEPRFEFTVKDVIGDRVPFLGKPDCRFVHECGVHVILDWKVKGYCSKYGASPSKNYMLCRDGYDAVKLGVGATKKNPEGKQSASHGKAHKNYEPYDHLDMRPLHAPGPSAAGSPMQFKRKRIRGKTQKTYKEWQSDCGHYRVCWRNEISGLGSARYYAAVRCDRGDGCELWDFAADRRPYRTLKAAQKACSQNQWVWQQFIDLADAPRKGRIELARQQITGSVVGTKPTAGRILNSCPPIWALPKLAPWLLHLVSPDHKELHA